MVTREISGLGVHRTDRNDEGWYEDTEVKGFEKRQHQWNFWRKTWEEMFVSCGIQLFDNSLAEKCGALKPGVFFFGVKL